MQQEWEVFSLSSFPGVREATSLWLSWSYTGSAVFVKPVPDQSQASLTVLQPSCTSAWTCTRGDHPKSDKHQPLQ